MAAQGPKDKRQVCGRCFAVVSEGVQECPECGAALGDETPAGADDQVYEDLTKANLFRIRGQYDEAAKRCLGILKRYPNNLSAHVLLGDIYAEQDDYEQASSWYELALDLAPGDPAVTAKLQSVRKRVETEDSLSTIEKLDIRTERPNTAAYVVAMTVFVLLVGAVAFWLGGLRESRATATADPVDVAQPEPVETVVSVEELQAETLQENPNLVQPEPTVTPQPPEPAPTSVEQAIINAVQQLGYTQVPVGVMVDPRGPTASVRLVFDVVPDPYPAAAAVGYVAHEAVPELDSVEVLMEDRNGLRFAADLTSESYERLQIAGDSNSDEWARASRQSLQNVWESGESGSP